MNVATEPPVALYSQGNIMADAFGTVFSLEHMKDMLARNAGQKEEVKPPRAIVIASGGGHLAEALLAIEGVPLRVIIVTLRLPHTVTLRASAGSVII
jgi:hypothetical protein